MRTLTDVRRDIVQTIRQVVDIVSKYAGSALPEPARSRVRGFILHLPQRWATASVNSAPGIPDGAPGASSAVGAAAGGAGSMRRARTTRHKERSAGGPDRSQACTPTSSRASSPMGSVRVGLRPTTSAATQAAQRVLALATESLDMMRGVTGVVKDSLDRADAYVKFFHIMPLLTDVFSDGLSVCALLAYSASNLTMIQIPLILPHHYSHNTKGRPLFQVFHPLPRHHFLLYPLRLRLVIPHQPRPLLIPLLMPLEWVSGWARRALERH